MHPIFFVWLGTYTELCATGMFYHGGASRTVAIEHHRKYIGTIASSPASRKAIAALHANLTVLPGPNGKISGAQAVALNRVLPFEVSEGDVMEKVLRHVHSLYGDDEFNPDIY